MLNLKQFVHATTYWQGIKREASQHTNVECEQSCHKLGHHLDGELIMSKKSQKDIKNINNAKIRYM
jgi:hypothetical protein